MGGRRGWEGDAPFEETIAPGAVQRLCPAEIPSRAPAMNAPAAPCTRSGPFFASMLTRGGNIAELYRFSIIHGKSPLHETYEILKRTWLSQMHVLDTE